jgi:hypothetical protein
MVNYLVNANPKGPWVADMDGYLPLHWAVNQDVPNIGKLDFTLLGLSCIMIDSVHDWLSTMMIMMMQQRR